MASEEEKKRLLLLIPVLLKNNTLYPPLLDLNSFTLTAVSSYEAYSHANTVKAFKEHARLERQRSRPTLSFRPKQGGQRITEDFLLSLDTKVCLYYFRCVYIMSLVYICSKLE